MSRDAVQKTMLFDFFGELLTEKQREYYDLHYNEDLSLAEIAEQNGVSRQGVWDTIRRAEGTLEEFEEKTGIVARFMEMNRTLAGLESAARELRELSGGRGAELCDDIAAGLAKLRS